MRIAYSQLRPLPPELSVCGLVGGRGRAIALVLLVRAALALKLGLSPSEGMVVVHPRVESFLDEQIPNMVLELVSTRCCNATI